MDQLCGDVICMLMPTAFVFFASYQSAGVLGNLFHGSIASLFVCMIADEEMYMGERRHGPDQLIEFMKLRQGDHLRADFDNKRAQMYIKQNVDQTKITVLPVDDINNGQDNIKINITNVPMAQQNDDFTQRSKMEDTRPGTNDPIIAQMQMQQRQTPSNHDEIVASKPFFPSTNDKEGTLGHYKGWDSRVGTPFSIADEDNDVIYEEPEAEQQPSILEQSIASQHPDVWGMEEEASQSQRQQSPNKQDIASRPNSYLQVPKPQSGGMFQKRQEQQRTGSSQSSNQRKIDSFKPKSHSSNRSQSSQPPTVVSFKPRQNF